MVKKTEKAEKEETNEIGEEKIEKRSETEKKTAQKVDKKEAKEVVEEIEETPKEEKKPKQSKAKEIDLQELLKAGAHFGHQTQRWNPKMAPYIFTKRNNVHIFDLVKTAEKLKEALEFVYNVSSNGGTVLFVGTKKQAQQIIKEEALKADSFFVSERWLGGMLTNFSTISARINYLDKLENDIAENKFTTKKEKLDATEERDRLLNIFEGIRKMRKLPDAIYVIDIIKENNAVKEAKRLGIPVVGIVDTNADPDEIKYTIPANDDAVKAIKLITQVVADTILEGKSALSK